MDSATSAPHNDWPSAPTVVKVLIAGDFGVGKTTLVGSVSEIRPLLTEEPVRAATASNNAIDGSESEEIIAAMDFGRLTLSNGIILYLFGTPGQDRRCRALWDELASGAIGAIVLADARRPGDCAPSVEYFKSRGTPYTVAINCFGERRSRRTDALRRTIGLDPHVPLQMCDARDRDSVMDVLVTLVEHVLLTTESGRTCGT